MEGKRLPGLGLLKPHPPNKPPQPKPQQVVSHRSSKLPPIRKNPVTEQYGLYSQLTQPLYPGGYAPKVQLPFQTVPGQIPRKSKIERRRREYLHIDIAQLLAEKGIDSNLLMPRHWGREGHMTTQDDNVPTDHVTTSENPVPPVSNYLSLEIFDNEEYDPRTPEEWMGLGWTEGSPDRKPIPAKALLPATNNTPPGKLPSDKK